MKKISLLSVVILSMLSTSCGNNSSFSSLNEAMNSIEENFDATFDLMKKYQDDKGLLIKDEVYVEYLNLDEKKEVKSVSTMNVSKERKEAIYDIDLSSDNKKVKCYVINEDLYLNFDDEEKYHYSLSQKEDFDKVEVDSYKELIFESGLIGITLSWISNEITSDSYLLELDKISLKYYRISFLALLGKNDRILLAKTMDIIKENINLYLLYEGNPSLVTLSIDKEKFDKAIDNIKDNIDTSLSTIKNKPSTYGTNIKSIYEKISSFLSKCDLKQLENLSLTINSKKKIIKQFLLKMNTLSSIYLDINYKFSFFNKYESLNFPNDLNKYLPK